MTFYGPEEATIAYNEKKLDIHAPIHVYVEDLDENGNLVKTMVETSVGRLMVNEFVPKEIGYVNEVLGKKSLRDIIGRVIKACGVARTAQFLDDIKNLGYYMAFKGGLSFNLADVLIPPERMSWFRRDTMRLSRSWLTIIWVSLPTTSVITRLSILGHTLIVTCLIS